MTGSEPAPSGLARRRRRISDQETEQRMLQTALAMVHNTGLTVSLEHISLEEVIREAGVARSAVYRRWPYKDLFFSDLLLELAEGAGNDALPDDAATLDIIRNVTAHRSDWLHTPELRHELFIELLRQSGLGNFQFFHGSTHWRTYVALHATFLSLPASDFRDDVQDALTRSEQHVVDQISASYQHWAGLLGYRMRPETGASFGTMATALNAMMRGLVLMAPSIPDIVTQRFQAAPFGTDAQWSQPALGIASIVVTHLEPDPAVDWTEERIANVTRELAQ